MKRLTVTHILAASAVLFHLSGCGGGGGGTDSSTRAPSPQAVSFVSTGTVTGFGSVFVNGVRHETSGAAFTINGAAGTQSELRVGYVVTVSGHRDARGNSFADRVKFDDLVKGPVQSVDVASGRLVVLGQTVLTGADTSFDDDIAGSSLAAIAVGDILEVSGMRRADGSIQATRLERKPAGTVFEVTGVASQVDSVARKFKITALTVNYSVANVQDFPSGQPRNGDLVEARGSSVNAAGELIARSIELERDDDMNAGMEVELEGFITRFASPTDFDVAGKRVTTNANTRFENGTAANLAVNVKVEVEGRADATGVLVATEVEFKRQANSRIEALVDSVNRTANTLVVLGIDVAVTASTRLEDNSSALLSNFNLGNLAAGDYVVVRGAESPAGSNDVIASSLERRRPVSEVRLRGTVDTLMRPSFTILGVTIQTNAATQFDDDTDAAMSADAFFAAAAGKIVAVKGSLSAGVLIAREVEFEDDDD